MPEGLEHIRPLIFWEGFPACGLMIRRVVEAFGDGIAVLGTRAAVPFEGLEELLGTKIEWLEDPDDIWDLRERYRDRNFIIHTGWNHKGWLRFGGYMRRRYGARVVVAVDNRYAGTLRQRAGWIWFRLRMRRRFDAALVPGSAATRLMRFYGMPSDRIHTGYYGASEKIYWPGPPIGSRRAEFLYVGQLIRRKSIDVLVDGYREYRKAGGRWALRMLGDGPLKSRCRGEGILLEGFAQPPEAAERMRAARCGVLISREDHWGTALCEAAACGTLLISAPTVGASEDLLKPGVNGVRLSRLTPDAVAEAMMEIENLDTEQAEDGSRYSVEVASKYSSQAYYQAFQALVRQLF